MLIARRFTLLVVMMLMAMSAFAQKGHSKTMTPKPQTVYVCDQCHMADMKAGKCAVCKMDKMKVSATVMYHCEHCNKDMMKGGMCPTCKGKTTKMASFYACDHCHTTSSKMGKCPKCKMDMTKHSVKMG